MSKTKESVACQVTKSRSWRGEIKPQTAAISRLILTLIATLPALTAGAQDAITNVVSQIVSYQYTEDFGSEALTNGGINSPIFSYQYVEAFPFSISQSEPSSTASYYYQFVDALLPKITPTTRTPTAAETTPTGGQTSTTTSRLMAFHGGVFTENLNSVDANQMTIVLTHGWVPLAPVFGTPLFTPNGIDDWPTNMAWLIRAQGVTANLVAWDWRDAATSPVTNPRQAGSKTGDEGLALGEALLKLLGPTYSHPLHFIGHSFGTLVNASAANYLQGTNWASESVSPTPWPAKNMHMTLFDEAEIGTDKDFNPFDGDLETLANVAAAFIGVGNNVFSASPYFHPLPKQFAWADNYVAAVGLLYPGAANVILSKGLPNAPNLFDWFKDFGAFHSYPQLWYEHTIEADASELGFLWSFERRALFFYGPQPGSVYLQSSSDFSLTQKDWNYGTNYIVQRLNSYRKGLVTSAANVDGTILAAGEASAVFVANKTGELVVNLWTGLADSLPLNKGIRPLGSGPSPGGGANGAAYAWIPLVIPPNAVSISFQFKIKGDWQSDCLAAAIDGTNVLFFRGSQIQPNTYFSSGSINVSALGGTTNQLFIGIVGGTSTNALVTVANLTFSLSVQPALTAAAAGSSLVLSWPLSSQAWLLETTTNIASGYWTPLTNPPAVVNLQNVVTNPISIGERFYRLKQ